MSLYPKVTLSRMRAEISGERRGSACETDGTLAQATHSRRKVETQEKDQGHRREVLRTVTKHGGRCATRLANSMCESLTAVASLRAQQSRPQRTSRPPRTSRFASRFSFFDKGSAGLDLAAAYLVGLQQRGVALLQHVACVL